MLRILNIEPDNYSEDARFILKSLGELVESPMSRKELLQQIGNFDVLIVRLKHSIDKELIESASNLKVIITATTGLDHIDLDTANEHGIQVLSLRGELEFLRTISATAEHTWGLILALVRNIPWAHNAVLQGEWQRDAYRGHDLFGKHLGILGLGRLGEKVAGYGLAFGMQVSAYDPYRPDWIPGISKRDTLQSLLNDSDILSIHIPLNSSTQNIIGRSELGLLPDHACLVNTSRGAILDEKALLFALEKGQLTGAALDVICDEYQIQQGFQSPLQEYAINHNNLLLTPHIGGATFESMAATENFMVRKLKKYLQENNIV